MYTKALLTQVYFVIAFYTASLHMCFTYKNLNMNLKYKCQDGFSISGAPRVCLSLLLEVTQQ